MPNDKNLLKRTVKSSSTLSSAFGASDRIVRQKRRNQASAVNSASTGKEKARIARDFIKQNRKRK